MRVSFSTNLNKLEIRSLPFVKFWISVLKILLSRILNYICFSVFGPFESLVPVSLMFLWSFCFDASGFVFCRVLNISINLFRVSPIISYHLIKLIIISVLQNVGITLMQSISLRSLLKSWNQSHYYLDFGIELNEFIFKVDLFHICSCFGLARTQLFYKSNHVSGCV